MAAEIDQFKEKIQIEENTNTFLNEEFTNISIDNISDDNINDEIETNDDPSETYTEILNQINNLEINATTMEEPAINTPEINTNTKHEPSTSTSTRERLHPRTSSPNYFSADYGSYDREETLWNRRLNTKWIPNKVPEQSSFLDLDCVTDITKILQLWLGNISKQLIDNKISIAQTPGYIERTLTGVVKLWLHNLAEDSIATLRNDKKNDGTAAASNIDILYKYKIGIRNEFGSMTTELAEQIKDKNLNRNLMNKLAICNMCYIEQYTCAFKEYYYKSIYPRRRHRS